MAMNAATFKAALLAGFEAKVRPIFDGIADNHQLTGKDFTTIWGKISEVIADETVGHITSFARCNGVDSNNDTHGNVQIV